MPEVLTLSDVNDRLYDAGHPKSFPNISQIQIQTELREASKDVGFYLREVMAPPLIDFCDRLETALLDPEIVERINELAYRFPIDRVPFTEQLPGLSRTTPEELLDPAKKVRECFEAMVAHDCLITGKGATHGRTYSQLEAQTRLAIESGGTLLDDEMWRLWTEAHEAQDNRNYCNLGSIASIFSGVRHKEDDFFTVERRVLAHCFADVYPTFYTTTAGSPYRPVTHEVLFPIEPGKEEDGSRKRWVRAAAVLLTLVGEDEQLLSDIQERLLRSKAHQTTVKTRTLRASDTPHNEITSVIRGYKEAIGRLFTSVNAELLQTQDGDIETVAIRQAEIILFRLISAFTRKASLGIGGPIGVQGKGFDKPPVERTIRETPSQKYPGVYRAKISPEANVLFRAAREYWEREFHYKELKKHQEAPGENPVPIRTGGTCPFTQPSEGFTDNAIEAVARMLYVLSAVIDPDGKETSYSLLEGKPFVPPEAIDLKEYGVRPPVSNRQRKRFGLLLAKRVLLDGQLQGAVDLGALQRAAK